MADELKFKNEQELLSHTAVLQEIDKKVTEAEQDAYEKIDKFKGMLVSQAVSLGLEIDSFVTQGLKVVIDEGDSEKISKAYDELCEKLNKRSMDSLCDLLSDINGEYIRKAGDKDSVNGKLKAAMDKQPGDDKNNGQDNNTTKNGDGKDEKNKNKPGGSQEEINNPDGGTPSSSDGSDGAENPFDQVTK